MSNEDNKKRVKIDDIYPNEGILWRGKTNTHDVEAVGDVDLSKPTLIYMGGIHYFTKSETAVSKQCNKASDMLSQAVQANDYHFYSYTVKGKDPIKTKKQHNEQVQATIAEYKSNPNVYYSQKAKNFVEQALAHYIPSSAGLSEDKRAEAMQTLLTQFSNLTFLGHSYGTTFIQETRNALVATLDKKGFTEQEYTAAVEAIAAVNIGPISEPKDKHPDFSQVTLIFDKDKLSAQNSNITISNTALGFNEDDQPIKKAHIGNHHVLLGATPTNRLKRVSFSNSKENTSWRDLINGDSDLTTDQPELSSNVTNKEVDIHNQPIYTTSLRTWLTDDGVSYLMSSNHIGINSVRLLGELVKASHDSEVRDAKTVISDTIERYINPEQMKIDAAHIQFVGRLFDNVAKDVEITR